MVESCDMTYPACARAPRTAEKNTASRVFAATLLFRLSLTTDRGTVSLRGREKFAGGPGASANRDTYGGAGGARKPRERTCSNWALAAPPSLSSCWRAVLACQQAGSVLDFVVELELQISRSGLEREREGERTRERGGEMMETVITRSRVTSCCTSLSGARASVGRTHFNRRIGNTSARYVSLTPTALASTG